MNLSLRHVHGEICRAQTQAKTLSALENISLKIRLSLTRFPGHFTEVGEEPTHEVCLGKTASVIQYRVQV